MDLEGAGSPDPPLPSKRRLTIGCVQRGLTLGCRWIREEVFVSVPAPHDVAERLVAEAPNTAWLRALTDDLDRRLRASEIDRLMRLWALSAGEVARIFAVSRQAISKWRHSGIPANRMPAMADLAIATDLLDRYVKRERIPAVVRRSADMLGGRSLLDLAFEQKYEAVREAVTNMFDLRRVQA